MVGQRDCSFDSGAAKGTIRFSGVKDCEMGGTSRHTESDGEWHMKEQVDEALAALNKDPDKIGANFCCR